MSKKPQEEECRLRCATWSVLDRPTEALSCVAVESANCCKVAVGK